MWRTVCRFAPEVLLAAFIVSLFFVVLACADQEAAAELGEPSGGVRESAVETVEGDDNALQKAAAETNESEPAPRLSGAAAEIDEFFFAPIRFPGFGSISSNCNLDNDPYGACL